MLVKKITFKLLLITIINIVSLNSFCQTISDIDRELKIVDSDFVFNHIVESEIITKKALHSSKKINYKKGELIALYNLAKIEFLKGSNKTAITLFKNTLQLALVQKNQKYVKLSYYALGVAYNNIGNFKFASENLEKALYLFEDNEKYKPLILIEIGRIHKNYKLIDDAIKYGENALKLASKYKHTSVKGYAYVYLTSFYIEQNNLKKAKSLLTLSAPLVKKINLSVVTYIFNEAYSNYYVATNDLDSALEYALLGENNALNLNISKVFFQIGKVYFLKKEYQQALVYLNNAYQEAIKVDELKTIELVTHYLAKIYALQKDFKKSNLFYEKYIVVKDSLSNRLNLQLIANIKTKYDNEKKEKEISENKLLIIQQKNEIEKRNFFVIFLLIITIIVIIGFYFFYKQQQKLKNEEIQTLKNQKEINKLHLISQGEDRERKRIAQDLHDGVNGDLAVVKYRLSSIDKNSDDLDAEINKTTELLDNSIDRLRELSHSLYTPFISQLTIQELINQYCKRTSYAKKINISFEKLGSDILLNKMQKKSLYIIFQELIQNILKHSEADEIDVQISCHNKLLMLVVEDNGIGYDVKTNKEGRGLINIKSRLSLIDATLDVVSSNNGTSVTIQLNLE